MQVQLLPTGHMRLIITRHGKSEENSSGILQGLLPGKLNDIGKIQASQLGQRLSRENIDVIYCSPVNRCQETLEIIKKYINPSIPINISNSIQERDFGKLSGKAQSELNFSNLDEDTKENRALGIESLNALDQRTRKFIDEIKSKHQNQTVLVISHSNPIRMMFAYLLNMTFFEVLEKIKIKNASVNIFDIGKTVIPVVISETDFIS